MGGPHRRGRGCRRAEQILRVQLQPLRGGAGGYLRKRLCTPPARVRVADLPHALELLRPALQQRLHLRLGLRPGLLQHHRHGRPGVGRAQVHHLDVRHVGHGRLCRSVVLRLELPLGTDLLDRQLGLELRLELMVQPLVQLLVRAVGTLVLLLVPSRLGLGTRLDRTPRRRSGPPLPPHDRPPALVQRAGSRPQLRLRSEPRLLVVVQHPRRTLRPGRARRIDLGQPLVRHAQPVDGLLVLQPL